MANIETAGWKAMWVIAASLFAAAKLVTWWPNRRLARLPRSLGYLLAWPGMNAREFLAGACLSPAAAEWVRPAANTIAGATILLGAPRVLGVLGPLAGGWTAMIGLILLLHFGSFHLLALTWQSFGVAATPIMQHPLASTSIAEFWGRRWNLGFHALAHDFVFRPLRRRTGPVVATLSAFLASGLVHDLVISVPARGGYGLPTAYFLLQGCGVLIERRFGWHSRAFTIAVVALPVYWLFHPLFVERVIGSIL